MTRVDLKQRSATAGVVVYIAFLIILTATALASVGRWWFSLSLFALATVLGLLARSEFRPRGGRVHVPAAPVDEEGTGAAPPLRRAR